MRSPSPLRLASLSALCWLLCGLVADRPARAQTSATATTTTTTGLASLVGADFTWFFDRQNPDGSWEAMNKTTFDTFFNHARCGCKAPVRVRIVLSSAGRTKVNGGRGTVKLRAGDSSCVCNTAAACLNSACTDLSTAQDVVGLLNSYMEFTTTVDALFQAGHASDTGDLCNREENKNLWIWIDSLTDSSDFTVITDGSTAVALDGAGPPAPSGVEVVGGNDALAVSWPEIAKLADFQGYQVLCARGGRYAPFPGVFKPGFESSVTACPAGSSSSALTADDTSVAVQAATQTTTNIPLDLAALNTDFLCSDLLTSGHDTRIFRLENGVPYVVGVVSVDLRKNASPITQVAIQTPTPTRDFYAGYRADGGDAEGGFCALAGGAPGGPATTATRAARTPWLLAAAGLALIGLGRRRHRRPRDGAALVLVVATGCLLAGRDAHAQVISRPNESFRSAKHFALELRFGPYSPDIDAEFGGAKTPHQDYFGSGRRLMTQVELDYQFITEFGSAAIGGSVGYYRERAKAFLDQGPTVTPSIRSGDQTQLSLYPFALLGVYRADQLYRNLGIPLVPYGKLGLSYTIWSVYDGNDEVADGDSVGKTGRGRGGTLGWQMAAGLSLSLDFIDPGSARELDSDTGVNHTYVFVEWDKYAISGLGQSGKLNLGDTTWTAGLMFEF